MKFYLLSKVSLETPSQTCPGFVYMASLNAIKLTRLTTTQSQPILTVTSSSNIKRHYRVKQCIRVKQKTALRSRIKSCEASLCLTQRERLPFSDLPCYVCGRPDHHCRNSIAVHVASQIITAAAALRCMWPARSSLCCGTYLPVGSHFTS